MNGKTVKILRRWARFKNYTEKSVKAMWTGFDRIQRGKAKRFFVHFVKLTDAAKKREKAALAAQKA